MRHKTCVVGAIALILLSQQVERAEAQGNNARLAVVPLSSTARRRTHALSLEQRIVADANKKVGQRIGDGQCTAFVSEVLSDVGCKGITHVQVPSYQNKHIVKIDSYGWGKHLVALGKGGKPVQPRAGNIIQFENCFFQKGGSSWNLGAPHHTSIVKSANGRVVTLLHQNMEGDVKKSRVREDIIDLSGLQSGSFYIYSAVAQ